VKRVVEDARQRARQDKSLQKRLSITGKEKSRKTAAGQLSWRENQLLETGRRLTMKAGSSKILVVVELAAGAWHCLSAGAGGS
jgi:ABC-type uncharacterized transport system ATPase subunit